MEFTTVDHSSSRFWSFGEQFLRKQWGGRSVISASLSFQLIGKFSLVFGMANVVSICRNYRILVEVFQGLLNHSFLLVFCELLFFRCGVVSIAFSIPDSVEEVVMLSMFEKMLLVDGLDELLRSVLPISSDYL